MPEITCTATVAMPTTPHETHPPLPFIKIMSESVNFIGRREHWLYHEPWLHQRHLPENGVSWGAHSGWDTDDPNLWAQAAQIRLNVEFVPVYHKRDVDRWLEHGPVPAINEAMRPTPSQPSVPAVNQPVQPAVSLPFIAIHGCHYRLMISTSEVHNSGEINTPFEIDYNGWGVADTIEEKQAFAKAHLGLPANHPDFPIMTREQIMDNFRALRQLPNWTRPAPVSQRVTVPLINNRIGNSYFLATDLNQLTLNGDTQGAFSMGTTTTPSQAQAFARGYLGRSSNDPGLPIYHGEELKMALLAQNQTKVVAPEPVKLSGAALQSWSKKILGEQLFKQVSEFPQNPTTRGLIYAKLRVWPFPEVPSDQNLAPDSGNAIMAWLHENQFKPQQTPPPTPESPASPAREDYVFRASFSENESGHCTFSRQVTRSGRARFTEEEILDIARECDGTREDFADKVQEAIREQGRNDFDTTDYGDTDYENEEVTGSDGDDDWDYGNLNSVVNTFLERHPEIELED